VSTLTAITGSSHDSGFCQSSVVAFMSPVLAAEEWILRSIPSIQARGSVMGVAAALDDSPCFLPTNVTQHVTKAYAERQKYKLTKAAFMLADASNTLFNNAVYAPLTISWCCG
jgi:hypothetical protein